MRGMMSKKRLAWVAATLLVVVVAAVYLQQNPLQFGSGTQKDGAARTTEETAKEKTAQQQTKKAETQKATNAREAANEGTAYTYTAKAGDSYTGMVRQALASYAKANSVGDYDSLATEVALVNAAGSPLLEIGQKVSVKTADVAAAIEKHQVKAAEKAETTEAKEVATSDSSSAGKDYTYTARHGDSYTLLARTAISAHLSDEKQSLTDAQRIAAETSVVAAAGHPELAAEQKVTISKAAVQEAVAVAAKLSAGQQAAWQPYVALADL